MPVMPMNGIAQVAYAAGFRGESLVIAVAVAQAESSGRTDVVNSIGCVGLWQIYQKVHPWAGTIDQLKNPAINARAAYTISKGGTTWKPWEAFTLGMHNRYMEAARASVAAIPGANAPGAPPPPASEQPSPTNPIEPPATAEDPIGTLGAALSDPATWIRVLTVVAGVVLVIFAVVKLTADSPVGGTVAGLARTAVDFVPGGGVVKRTIKAAV